MKGSSIAFLQDDSALAVQAAHSPEAFAELYRRYYSRVFNYARYRCEDLETTEDLTAQIFERLLLKINSYCPERSPFSAWLFAIVRNEVSGHWRSAHRRLWVSIESLWHWPSREVNPEQAAIQTEAQADLLTAIQKLSERERDLLGLKFGGRLTNRKIAELTGLSESNVGVILYRAIGRLRDELSGEEEIFMALAAMEHTHERA